MSRRAARRGAEEKENSAGFGNDFMVPPKNK
jgi:hypothetical protein